MIKSTYVLIVFVLTGCVLTPQSVRSQEDQLRDLGISSPADFSLLSPCQQIKKYTEFGSEYLDMDHFTAIVPRWMNDEIAAQQKDVVAKCIAEQGELLLGQIGDSYNTENLHRVYQIHALIYKADDLKMVGDTEVEHFVLSAMCNEKVYYRENIAMLYYASTQSNLQDFPDPILIIQNVCK